MKEHDDDVLPTVKESTAIVDSTTADETATVRGKIEGIFGEKDEGEDMVVDVVGADVVVDDGGGTGVDLEGKVSINGLMEEGSKSEIGPSDMDVDKVATVEEVTVVSSEKVEVVVSDEGVKTSVELSKEVIQETVLTTTAVSENPKTGGEESAVKDNNEVTERESTGKESDVSNSLKFPESFTATVNDSGSRDAHMAAVKEGLFGKDEGEDGVVDNQGASEDNVHVSTKNFDQQPEVDQTKEILQPITEVATSDVQDSGNGTQVEDSNPALQSIESVQEVGKSMESVEEVADEVLDSTKIPDSETKVDVVVVEEGLSGKEEVQDNVSKDPTESVQEVADVDLSFDEKTKKEEVLDSTKIPDSVSKVDEVAGNIDQKAEVKMEKEEDTSHSTIEVKTDNDQKSGIDAIDNKAKEQEIVDKDHVRSEKSEKEVEVPNPDVQNFEEVNHGTTSHGDYGEEDAGMDIDEVLGWKDEIPGIDSHEKDQDFKINPNPNPNPNPNLEHEHLPKPLVYERRVHVNNDDDNVDVEEEEDHNTDFCRQQEIEPEQSALTDDVSEDPLNNETEASVSFNQSSYFHPPETEGNFSSSDLVWGKVRSHPWWPGQIFDQNDASEKAMKYHKKDRFLVAYFGDRTFAWNDSTVLKPFRAKFSQIDKNTNSEAFNNALHCALEEVSRRVELGLACCCTPHDVYKKIECQIVENAGIKKESSKRHGTDKTALVSSFEPDKLLDYVRLLAKSPYDENDKLDLVMAKAQLLSCARFKGYRQLSDGEDGSRKRKSSDSHSDVLEKRPTLESVTPTPKPSFKVGELIQRVANQLSDKNVEPVDQTLPVNPMVNTVNNLPDMLSQLQLTAQDPMKSHTFLNTIIPFFYSHRAAVFSKSLKQNPPSGRLLNETKKRKPSNENDPEDFEFDDVNDSYWTDRIIQNHPEEIQLQQVQQQVQLAQVHGNQNGVAEHQIVAYEVQEKPVKQSRRSNKKRFFSSNHEIEAKEQSELIERRRLNLATEVLMKFPEGIYFPSEIHLNKMFRRFGPLMESETEVDRVSGRARVVFKKCSDAEVAHSSAGKFSIFGSVVVHYELNYTPLISYKPLPLPISHEQPGEM